jgi:hypothetical protein
LAYAELLRLILRCSLKNQLGPYHKLSRWDIATPKSWLFGSNNLPTINEYELLQNCLLQDFDMMESTEFVKNL